MIVLVAWYPAAASAFFFTEFSASGSVGKHGSTTFFSSRALPQFCAFTSPPLPVIRLRGARSVAICMQKDVGGKNQPQKADKKLRKRSSAKPRAQDPFALPEPQMKTGGGPIGKAKRRMLERIGEMDIWHGSHEKYWEEEY
jgi:hypothetical protein